MSLLRSAARPRRRLRGVRRYDDQPAARLPSLVDGARRRGRLRAQVRATAAGPRDRLAARSHRRTIHDGRLGMKISARNQFSGTVKNVTEGAVMSEVIVTLDGGQEMVAAITAESARTL